METVKTRFYCLRQFTGFLLDEKLKKKWVKTLASSKSVSNHSFVINTKDTAGE